MDGLNSRSEDTTLPPDEELMIGLRAGNPAVLRALLSRYLSPLQRYATGFLGGRSDAEEAVQEAFVRLWEKRECWRRDGSVKSLLFILTRNAAVDSLRRRRRETLLPAERLQNLPSPEPTPYEDAVEGEFRSMAEAAISRLPSRRQEIFRLVREGGLSYREVAETLGISSQTVANLMSLALSDLRSSLLPALEASIPSSNSRTGEVPAKKASGSD